MSVTIKDIKRVFNTVRVEQVNSKQLFKVDLVGGDRVLISYYTIVGRYINNQWYLTKEKYSRTTTAQLHSFARQCFNHIWVDEL